MIFNQEILQQLNRYRIPKDEGLLYLIGTYFKIDTASISDEIKKLVNIADIFERDYKTDSINWNIALFEGQETEWDWVTNEWRKMFSDLNKERDGTKRFVISRMKDFFAKHPKFRKDDVMGATKLYILSVTDPHYLKSADKFIQEGNGTVKNSMLEQWLDIYIEQNKPTVNNNKAGLVR